MIVLPFERVGDRKWQFLGQRFFQKQAQTEIANGKMTKITVEIS